MPNPDIAVQRFQDTPCTVVVGNNYDTQGAQSLTRSSIAELTPAQLQTLFAPSGLFADMDSWFRTSFEMKACGIKTNGMYEWIMSSMRQMGDLMSIEKVDRGPSLLKPFVLGRQDSVINKDFWAITTGFAVSGYTATVTGPLTAGDLTANGALTTDRVIRVVSRYGLYLSEKWFQNRDVVNILSNVSGNAGRGSWKVLASEPATDGSYIDVVVTSQNAGSASIYDAAPTSGLLLAMSNNVSDYESFCNNRPTLDPRKRVPFYFQTMRRSRRVDAEYMKVFSRLMESNQYFREFGDLPLAERNRQDEEEYQHRWVTTFFFGKPISANQTLSNWQSLDQILTVTSTGVDPGLGGKLVGYRANMIGVYEQMKACGRVQDLQNNPLNLYELFKAIYLIVRARKSQGRKADSIDIYTDSEYAAFFESAMVNYYIQEYGNIVRFNLDVTSGGNTLGFQWRSYTVKFPIGVKINIITHEFFDDLATAAANESIGSTGTFMLILDMGKPGAKGGTIYPGMIATNRKKRTLGELEKLAAIDATFSCVMEHTTEEIMLSSETVTAVVECPANSLWIENIARTVPKTTGLSLNPTYTNLY